MGGAGKTETAHKLVLSHNTCPNNAIAMIRINSMLVMYVREACEKTGRVVLKRTFSEFVMVSEEVDGTNTATVEAHTQLLKNRCGCCRKCTSATCVCHRTNRVEYRRTRVLFERVYEKTGVVEQVPISTGARWVNFHVLGAAG